MQYRPDGLIFAQHRAFELVAAFLGEASVGDRRAADVLSLSASLRLACRTETCCGAAPSSRKRATKR